MTEVQGALLSRKENRMEPSRRDLLKFAGGAAAAALPASARALDYPVRPVHLVVGFAAGGGADIIARLVGMPLGERLGQTMVVDNRPGAGTNIATETVVKAP